MARLDLSREEREMLREVLESYLSDLRMEIADTDDADFRQGMKDREVFLKKLIGQLAQ